MKGELYIKIYSCDLDILLASLELYCLNLNHIHIFPDDIEQKNLQYSYAYYLYDNLLSYSNTYRATKFPKPKEKNNILKLFVK